MSTPLDQHNSYSLRPTRSPIPTDLLRSYGKKLAVVVPYRDRADHLQQFLPHLCAYFERDKLDKRISVSVHIVEQAGAAAFNRGMVKNCGFALVYGGADYVCFHDVDYLPVWADYAWSARPARLIWHGLRLQQDREQFFGGVVLFDRDAFAKINGYPNSYWGWGFEDVELAARCQTIGGFECRDGTYIALQHVHAGFTPQGGLNDEAQRTYRHWRERQQDIPTAMTSDGLNTLRFRVLRQAHIRVDSANRVPVVHHIIDIGMPPATPP
jgi:hypothetical protein